MPRVCPIEKSYSSSSSSDSQNYSDSEGDDESSASLADSYDLSVAYMHGAEIKLKSSINSNPKNDQKKQSNTRKRCTPNKKAVSFILS